MAEHWRGSLINEKKGNPLKFSGRAHIAFASSTNTSPCLITEEMIRWYKPNPSSTSNCTLKHPALHCISYRSNNLPFNPFF